MGKIGWGVVYATGTMVAAPAMAGAAVLAVGYWVEEAIRNASHSPSRWEIDLRDDVRLDRRLASLAADLNRERA